VLAGVLSVLGAACPPDQLFARYDGAIPGASVAVIRDGAIVFERSYGLADLASGRRATPQTNYRLASITKQFTAMAIAMLAERKALSLDDPVARYLPELASVAPAVTLRHLLTHTSGLPEYEALLPKDATNQIVDRDVLALLSGHTAPGDPGKVYRYNNTGYALLALVVERVSRRSFAEFLRRDIFQPLGMTATLAYDPRANISHRAYGYAGHDPQFWNNDQTRTTAVLGDGGIYSSTKDLARWVAALDAATLVPAPRLAEATTPLVATDAPGVHYGLGWKISTFDGEKLAFHTGTTSGFKNALLWVPSRKLAVVVLTNRRHGDPLFLALVVLGQFWEPPAAPRG
jgi:CubicO group peptidase (beta-lactamase class C family)